jgi:hypothetical protein
MVFQGGDGGRGYSYSYRNMCKIAGGGQTYSKPLIKPSSEWKSESNFGQDAQGGGLGQWEERGAKEKK